MQVKLQDGTIVIEPSNKQSLVNVDELKAKGLLNVVEPSYYVALDANGLLARSVLATTEDRIAVAQLVANWIAEGFQPKVVDLKTFARHVRELVAANKAPKAEAGEQQPQAPAGDAPAAGGEPSGESAPAADAKGTGDI